MPTLEPLYDRLLVRLLRPEERTRSGLYVPQLATDNTPFLKAEVLAVGHGRITTQGGIVPLAVKAGDVVVFYRSGKGDQIYYPTDDGSDQMLIQESHVAGILRGLDKVTSIVGVDGGNLELSS